MKIYNPFNFARKNAHWAITLVFILTALGSNAQSEGDNSGIMMFVVSLVAIVAVLVLMVAIYAFQVINKLEANQPARTEGEEEPSLWQRFLVIANNRADEDKEADIMLDHNYDGIRELDNHLPPWWKWLFYITIIWGAIYLIGHHFTGWFPLQEEEYEIAMADANADKQARQAANKEAGGFDEAALVYTDNADIIASGEKIYARKACNSCHGNLGEGNTIGPNLTDNYWLHGGGIKDVFTTIKKGVPDKGMIAWESQLSPSDIRDVATFILSLQGSKPANAKDPQGKLYGEGSSTDAEEEEVTEDVVEVAEAETSGDAPDGKNVFETTCAACHTADGGGVVGLGPNLTDKYWKNSNGSRDGIKKTITGGVAGTSMMAWSASLDEAQIEAVTDYVLSMQGTTPANPKEPEGDLYE